MPGFNYSGEADMTLRFSKAAGPRVLQGTALGLLVLTLAACAELPPADTAEPSYVAGAQTGSNLPKRDGKAMNVKVLEKDAAQDLLNKSVGPGTPGSK